MKSILSIGVFSIVFLLFWRERRLFLRDQKNAELILPYSKKKRNIRYGVCIVLLTLGILLIWGPVVFAKYLAFGLGSFLLCVFALTGVLMILAVMDFKESLRMSRWSKDKITQEMIYEIKQIYESPKDSSLN